MSAHQPVPKSVWGPARWYRLHCLAIFYPSEPSCRRAQRAAQDVALLLATLPCPECRTHALSYLEGRRPALESSEAFQRWAFDFHNWVNRRLGKRTLNYAEYLEEYEPELRARERREVLGFL
jgi:hypothetical protein